jgi:hypothetical protein
MDPADDPDLAVDEKTQVRSRRMALALPDLLENAAHQERKLRIVKIYHSPERHQRRNQNPAS